MLYAGDDVTDEDAFAALREGDIGLKIGPGVSLADHRVRGPAEVTEVLRRLADFRAAGAASAR